MKSESRTNILIAGVGGLGSQLVHEGLSRGSDVSVLVRDRAKLDTRLGEETVSKLTSITVGDATDPTALDRAMQNIDVVLSGNGAHPRMASELARAVRRNAMEKLVWPAGSTNLMSEDGVTPAYLGLVDQYPGAEDMYRAHQACIDAIREVGINYVIFCPSRMEAVGHRSPDVRSTVRVNRPAGMFVSYEDAAWVMIEGALTNAYDRELITAATPEDHREVPTAK